MSSDEWQNKIEDLLQFYENQLTKFEEYIDNNANNPTEAYWMVTGNIGMTKMIITDLEEVLK